MSVVEERRDELQPAPRRRRAYPRSAGPTVTPLPGTVQASPALLQGRHLTCPGCDTAQDLLSYSQFDVSEKYAEQVLPVLRCTECGHVFALHPYPGGVDA